MRNALVVLRRRYRVLLWCLALSLAFHFLFVPLIVSLFGYRRPMQAVREVVYQARSSSLRVERRAVPHPRSLPQPRTLAQPRTQPRPQQQQQQRPPPRREIARIEPHARISVPRVSSNSSSTVDFTHQQALFEKTIAQLRRENNPVLSAARPVQTPSAPKRYTYDFAGAFGTSQGEGILSPVKSWRDGPYDYYYVRYWVQYADGAVETGYVPWPLRYLPQADPFLNHWEHFPLPKPLPDFKLPAGLNLHPLIAFCLEHLSELESCPAEHD